MKKFSWIMALLAALAMVFVGVSCGGGGNDDPPVGPTELTIVLGDNFNYGHGYQTATTEDPHVDLADYFKGQVKVGEEFSISFKVKASRDLESSLDFGMVDPTAEASYWRKLTDSETAGPKGPEMTSGHKGSPTAPEGGWLKADQEVSVNIDTWKAIASAAGAGNANNKLYFQTSGQCQKSTCTTNCDWTVACEGTALKDSITLTITEFKLTRKGAAAKDCCTDCEIATCLDCVNGDCTDDCGADGTCCVPFVPPTFDGTKAIIKLGTTSKDITIEYTGSSGNTPKYFGDNSGYVTYSENYGAIHAQFELDLGSGSLADYSNLKFTYGAISGDTNYKTIRALASATKFSGYLGTEGHATVIGSVASGEAQEGAVNALTMDISGTLSGKVWILIAIHGGTAEYTISNIVFE